MDNYKAKALLESLRPMQENPSEGSPLPCPRCGLPRMDDVPLHNAQSRRADVMICNRCGRDEAMRDASRLPPLPLSEWSMVQSLESAGTDDPRLVPALTRHAESDWHLTDDDCAQYARKLSDSQYHLIQMTPLNPNEDHSAVFSDIITLTDYLGENGAADAELKSILDTYGYAGVQDIRSQYGETAAQVMCECIFESLCAGFEADIRFAGTKNECEKYITEFVSPDAQASSQD